MRYDYFCKECKNNFFVECSMSENRDNINCSECKSLNIKRIYNAKIIKKREVNKIIETEEDKIIHHQCSPEEDYID